MHPRLPGSAVTRLLAELKPKTVTIIGSLPELELADIAGEPAVTELTPAEHKRVAELGPQDLVAVGNTLEALPRRDGLGLLAGLRDLYARRILVRLMLDQTGWTQADMIGLGFSRVWHNDQALAYYGFDVGTYKTTPDWLNPRNWAHPELFDRYRW